MRKRMKRTAELLASPSIRDKLAAAVAALLNHFSIHNLVAFLLAAKPFLPTDQPPSCRWPLRREGKMKPEKRYNNGDGSHDSLPIIR